MATNYLALHPVFTMYVETSKLYQKRDFGKRQDYIHQWSARQISMTLHWMITTILLTTLFTLFTTVLCCIRPDFPSLNDSKLRILSTKLHIVFWVLLCPEVVLFWAVRQWFEAGIVAKEFRGEWCKITKIRCPIDHIQQIAVGRDAMVYFFSWAVSSFATGMANQPRHFHSLISSVLSTKMLSTSLTWPR